MGTRSFDPWSELKIRFFFIKAVKMTSWTAIFYEMMNRTFHTVFPNLFINKHISPISEWLPMPSPSLRGVVTPSTPFYHPWENEIQPMMLKPPLFSSQNLTPFLEPPNNPTISIQHVVHGTKHTHHSVRGSLRFPYSVLLLNFSILNVDFWYRKNVPLL